MSETDLETLQRLAAQIIDRVDYAREIHKNEQAIKDGPYGDDILDELRPFANAWFRAHHMKD